MGGGTCAGAMELLPPPGCCADAFVVWSRLIMAIILACTAKEDPIWASSSAVAEACTARDSES